MTGGGGVLILLRHKGRMHRAGSVDKKVQKGKEIKQKQKTKTCLHMYILNKHFIKRGMVSRAVVKPSIITRVPTVLAPNVYVRL